MQQQGLFPNDHLFGVILADGGVASYRCGSSRRSSSKTPVYYHLLFIHLCVRLRALESALQLFDASLQRGVQLNVIIRDFDQRRGSALTITPPGLLTYFVSGLGFLRPPGLVFLRLRTHGCWDSTVR